jgi:3-deoxy-D-manno-octulosonate 8-phosphate phosphatase (KDO 8-P phosphatase)
MAQSKSKLLKKAKNIRLLAMDVDGVLTGGEIVVLESGEEIKWWNAKDRLVLALLRDTSSPLIIAWITGRSSKSVSWSAEDLGVTHVAQGCKDKKTELARLLTHHKLTADQAAYIGDDLIDLPALKMAGLSICPSDATSDILKNVDYISPFPGGKGVVRDVIEFILKAQKKWDTVIAPYLS